MIQEFTNPFCIPDFTPTYNAVRDYVKKAQGDKGYLFTDRPELDTMCAIHYFGKDFYLHEAHIKAIRVNKDNELEILYDFCEARYNAKIIDRITKEHVGKPWESIEYSDSVYFIPTLLSIAESINQYK